MSKTAIQEQPADEVRRTRILEGAKQAFLAYGFQRTTMDDIARAAEISRPALYLMFRNKTDIYRALTTVFVEEMIANARATMSGDEPLAERLEKSLVCALTMIDEIESSPHGAEILDMKNSLAGDLVTDWRSRIGDIFEAAISAEMTKVETGNRPSARILSDMLLDAVEGMKTRQLSPNQQRETTAAFIGVITRVVAS